MSSGKTYSLRGLRADPCTNRKPFSRWERGRSARHSQLRSRPKDRPFRGGIESFRVEHCPLVVIAQEHDLALHHQVDAFARIGTVADDIAQAISFLDVVLGNVGQDGLEGFEVAVDVADKRLHAADLQ